MVSTCMQGSSRGIRAVPRVSSFFLSSTVSALTHASCSAEGSNGGRDGRAAPLPSPFTFTFTHARAAPLPSPASPLEGKGLAAPSPVAVGSKAALPAETPADPPAERDQSFRPRTLLLAAVPCGWRLGEPHATSAAVCAEDEEQWLRIARGGVSAGDLAAAAGLVEAIRCSFKNSFNGSFTRLMEPVATSSRSPVARR